MNRIVASIDTSERTRNPIKFLISLRPVVGDTEAEALAKAVEIEAQVKELAGAEAGGFGNKPQSHAAERLRALNGQVQDKRLWTAVAALTGGGSSTTGLIGTSEQIAESMADYVKVGIRSG